MGMSVGVGAMPTVCGWCRSLSPVVRGMVLGIRKCRTRRMGGRRRAGGAVGGWGHQPIRGYPSGQPRGRSSVSSGYLWASTVAGGPDEVQRWRELRRLRRWRSTQGIGRGGSVKSRYGLPGLESGHCRTGSRSAGSRTLRDQASGGNQTAHGHE